MTPSTASRPVCQIQRSSAGAPLRARHPSPRGRTQRQECRSDQARISTPAARRGRDRDRRKVRGRGPDASTRLPTEVATARSHERPAMSRRRGQHQEVGLAGAARHCPAAGRAPGTIAATPVNPMNRSTGCHEDGGPVVGGEARPSVMDARLEREGASDEEPGHGEGRQEPSPNGTSRIAPRHALRRPQAGSCLDGDPAAPPLATASSATT